MSKALIWSDLHIHSHKDTVDRLQDCLTALRWIFDTAIERKVQHVWFLGDLFHERSKIDVRNYLLTFEVFMDYMLSRKPEFDLVLIIGNHDMYHKEKWDINSVKPLTAIPNIRIIDSPTHEVIDGLAVDFCPHAENPIKELTKLKDNPGRLLLGHMAVHGARLNKLYGTKSDVIVEYDNDMVSVSVDQFQPWERTILGHYHGAQRVDERVEYLGSPLQLNFGESFEEKHIAVLDLDTLEMEYIKNDFSPKHLILSPDDIASYDLNKNFVRIVVDDMGKKDLTDLKRKLSSDYQLGSLDFKQKDKKVEEDRTIVEGAKAMLLNEEETIENYMKYKGVPAGMDAARLKAMGLRLCVTRK
jgi:DNA repair exonuclease SbcCD nuclease subunit